MRKNGAAPGRLVSGDKSHHTPHQSRDPHLFNASLLLVAPLFPQMLWEGVTVARLYIKPPWLEWASHLDLGWGPTCDPVCSDWVQKCTPPTVLSQQRFCFLHWNFDRFHRPCLLNSSSSSCGLSPTQDMQNTRNKSVGSGQASFHYSWLLSLLVLLAGLHLSSNMFFGWCSAFRARLACGLEGATVLCQFTVH